MKRKTFNFMFFYFSIIFCASASYASLIDTSRSIEAYASIGQPIAWSDTANGSYSATIDSEFSDPPAPAGNYVFTSHTVDFVNSQEASVYLSRRLESTAHNHPISQWSESYFQYEALIDSTVDYSWSLDYYFTDVSFIEGRYVNLSVARFDSYDNSWDNIYAANLGVYNGPDGLYEGTASFDVEEGNLYRVYLFHPSSLIQSSDLVTLVGNVSFNFNGATVPIPGAVWLLGSGLIGLVGIRRKIRKA